MDEYISRKAVMDAYEEEQRRPGPWRFETLINSVPAADVVQVVRCRECKYLIAVKAGNGDAMQVCNRTKSPVCFDDFCSRGEKAN